MTSRAYTEVRISLGYGLHTDSTLFPWIAQVRQTPISAFGGLMPEHWLIGSTAGASSLSITGLLAFFHADASGSRFGELTQGKIWTGKPSVPFKARDCLYKLYSCFCPIYASCSRLPVNSRGLAWLMSAHTAPIYGVAGRCSMGVRRLFLMAVPELVQERYHWVYSTPSRAY